MKVGDVIILQNLIDCDSNIELIEVWDRVLYIRKKKGRNTFHTRKQLSKDCTGIYINIFTFTKHEYKQFQLKYHPDRNEKYIEISKGLNRWKELLLECFKGEFSRSTYTDLITSFTKESSFFSSIQSIGIAMEQEARFFYRPNQSQSDIDTKASWASWEQKNFDWQRNRGKTKDDESAPF